MTKTKKLKVPPKQGEALTMGVAACRNRDFEAAERHFIEAAGYGDLRGDLADRVGAAYLDHKQNEKAIQWLVSGVQGRPQDASRRARYGLALLQAGFPQQAEQELRQAVQIEPWNAAAHNLLGYAAARQGKWHDAKQAFAVSYRLGPKDFPALINHANAMTDIGRYSGDKLALKDALNVYDEAEKLIPGHSQVCTGRAAASIAMGHWLSAADALKAVLKQGEDPRPRNEVGNCLKEACQTDESLIHFEQAAARTDDTLIVSNFLYMLQFAVKPDLPKIQKAHREFDDKFVKPLLEKSKPHDKGSDPNRILRIGYLSPDFNDHCQSFFLRPLLKNHDHNQVHVSLFHAGTKADHVTKEFLPLADKVHFKPNMPDQMWADGIREEKIDILVDLSMHMGFNKQLIVARKPAPIQVSWLAYPGDTFNSALDARFTSDALEGAEVWPTPAIKLPSFWCYEPTESYTEPTEAPYLKNGYITFGCLNSAFKLNKECLTVWAKLLGTIKDSKLILIGPGDRAGDNIKKLFQDNGAPSGSLVLVDRMPRAAYMGMMDKIDLCLDPFPVGGHTTMMDSFFRGVPTFCMKADELPIQRGGVAVWQHLNMPDISGGFVCSDAANYCEQVAIVVESGYLEKRRMFQQQFKESVLTDGPAFARSMESAYRFLFNRRCGT